MKRRVKIALIQSRAGEKVGENLTRTIQKTREAASRGAKIICLQELFAYPYFPQTRRKSCFHLAESASGKIVKTFLQIARCNRIAIVAPFFEKASGGEFFNSVAVIDADGKRLGVYRKLHVPYDPCFYEKFYFSPGNLGVRVFQTKYAKIAVMICYDQWFPEAARSAALQGAEIIFYPTAIGWDVRKGREPEEEKAWQTIQQSHAIANGVYVAVANRVGREENLQFWGRSFSAGPFGKILARASSNREEILTTDCDLSEIKKIRNAWPFFRDRRMDVYGK